MDYADFNNRFPENIPVVVMLCFFYLYCFVNEYQDNPKALMSEDENSFTAINVIDLKFKYWMK